MFIHSLAGNKTQDKRERGMDSFKLNDPSASGKWTRSLRAPRRQNQTHLGNGLARRTRTLCAVLKFHDLRLRLRDTHHSAKSTSLGVAAVSQASYSLGAVGYLIN
ncbi:hypothetical protein ElyMa_003997500 [Elysia marginata]|uniref:Uncharacterized protein n=1 Tax=Elysia marginata TaxID=1093978 RepID=A0AAV4G1N0_9GAST|nr:hypothetical protein ElyMa_003997500 [Elysia marginata]